FGTLDELMGALTLIQTKKITNFPVILFGSDYWDGLIRWLRERVLAANNVTQEDVDAIHIVDDPERVAEIVCQWHDKALVIDGDEDEPPPEGAPASRRLAERRPAAPDAGRVRASRRGRRRSE